MPFQLEQLRAAVRPFRLHWFPRLRSTNDHAALMRRRGRLYSPAIVLTGHQTAGRGRGGNRWWSDAGVLTVTFALPVEPRLSPQQLPLLAGLVVRNTAAELAAAPQIQLKWPNDIACDGRKLAGLLCERVNNTDLIGLGMNVNLASGTKARRAGGACSVPPSLAGTMIWLSQIAGRPFEMNEVLGLLARRLHHTLSRRDETSFAAALREYDQHHALLGQRLSVHNNGAPPLTGRCEGIDSTGRLVLRDGSRLHRVIAGHVVRADRV